MALGVLFISHSSKNNDEAIELRDWLRSEGYAETFLDLDPEHGLAPGQRWEEELQKAGERCSGIVILISPEWADSKWCFHEFKFAKALGKKIFPVLVKPTSFDDLPSELHSHYQLADVSKPDRKSDGLERLRIGLRRAGLDPKSFIWPPEDEPERAPYRGLQALTEKDAAVFFGRDHQITSGMDKLRQMRTGAPKRILTIAAASGAGKSSFLKAGLLARLERDRENFVVLPTVRPGRDALNGETGLLQAFGLEAFPLDEAHLSSALNALRDSVLDELRSLAAAGGDTHDVPPPTLILPIDQAEELFSTDNPTGAQALELLKQSLRVTPDLAIILTIRSDTLGTLQADSEIAMQLELFNLPALPPESFKEVIEGPAALAQPPIEIEPALTSRLIQDLNRSDALPLLSFTMERLAAEFAGDNLLELHEYTDGLGGVSGAINAAVEAAFERAKADPALPDTRHELDQLARKAFIPKLVQLDEADASPKRRVSKLSDLAEETRPLLRHFVQERLLVRGEADGNTVVEVSHEAVLRRWRRLSAWIGEERTMLIGLQRIKRSAEEWNGNEKTLNAHSPDLLVHRGERLEAAEAFFDREDFAQDLEGQPTAYLKACRVLEDAKHADAIAQAERERGHISRGVLWRRLTTAMVMIAALLTGWGLVTTAQGQRQIEQSYSQFLNREATAAFNENNYGRSIRLSLLAATDTALSPTVPGAQFTLGQAISAYKIETVLSGHSSSLAMSSHSLDGFKIVNGTRDGSTRLWAQREDGTWRSDLIDQNIRRVLSVEFSKDGSQILVVSDDPSVKVWKNNSDDTWSAQSLSVSSDWGVHANQSADGSRVLVTSIRENEIWMWLRRSDGTWTRQKIGNHSKPVLSAVFSPDGSQVLSFSYDQTARIWSQQENEEWTFESLEGHSGTIWWGEFSLDGSKVVTTSADGTARVWERQNAGVWRSETLAGHTDEVRKASFSPGGEKLVTASLDGTARVWDKRRDDEWRSEVLEGHSGEVWAALFSPDGLKIVTTGDGTARLWRPDGIGRWQSQVLAGREVDVIRASFTSDSSRLITSSSKGEIRIWDIKTDESIPRTLLTDDINTVRSATFSSDGRQILTSSDDKSVRFWSQNHRGEWQDEILYVHPDRVFSATYSSDQAKIVTASRNGLLHLFERQDAGGWSIQALEGHTDLVVSASFSPNARQVLSASRDGTARVWRRSDEGDWQSSVLGGHLDSLTSAAFSLDGEEIVTTSEDGTVRIWRRAGDGKWQDQLLEQRQVEAVHAEFSQDGTRLVAASEDGYTMVWEKVDDERWHRTASLRKSGRIRSAKFSPNGSKIVTTNGFDAVVWTLSADGTWEDAVLDGHSSTVFFAGFSPNGNQIVTTSDDNSARVWNKNAEGTWHSQVLMGHKLPIYSASFSPDGSRIVTAATDGAKVWDVHALLSDSDRQFALKKNPEMQLLPVLDDVCANLNSRQTLMLERYGDALVSQPLLSTITEDDLLAAPILNSIGLEPGQDVCQLRQPTAIDAVLSAVLPNFIWSGLQDEL